jgi:streptomycin 6-kinase
MVLKAGPPGEELQREIDALRLFNGEGMVQLLAADASAGVLLLERLKPGTPLSLVEDDEEATSCAARVMRSLWKPAPLVHSFATLAKWAEGLQRMRDLFQGGCGPFREVLVARAEQLFEQLLTSMKESLLIHGDLHEGNILKSEREPWLALDPKGVIGDPAYDATYFSLSQDSLLREAQPGRVLARRVDQLARELGFERARILDWGFALAVLTSWWSFEDHGRGWEEASARAELVASLG